MGNAIRIALGTHDLVMRPARADEIGRIGHLREAGRDKERDRLSMAGGLLLVHFYQKFVLG